MKLHDDPKDLSRRDFIVKSSVATVASMTFAVVLPACTTTGDQKRKQGSKAFSNAWVTIDSSGKLEFVCPRTEMGQGTGTGLSMLLCESMDYPIGKVTMVQAPADRLYKHKEYQLQTTGGSSSMHTEFEAMLNLGASIRDLFLRAAAKKYQVPVSSLKTSAGHVLVKGKKISYADLIPEAQTLDIMDIEFDPKKIRKGLVGKRIRRVDLNEKVDGSLKYGVDTDFEGLHHAYMIHAPILGALPKNSNADAIKKLPGVTDVVKTSRGFAVVATKHWQAMNAAGQLKTEWNEPEKVFDSGAYEKECLAHLKGDSHKNILDEGDSYKEQKTSLDVTYKVPYLAHACLEPQNCTVMIKGDKVTVWTSTQSPGLIPPVVADVADVSQSDVTVHCTAVGGGFGRRLEVDYVLDATEIAKASGKPIKMIWSREASTQTDFFRPAAYARMQVSISEDKKKVFWRQTMATQSIAKRQLPDFMPGISPMWMGLGFSKGLGSMVAWAMNGMTVKEGIMPSYNMTGVEVNWKETESPVPVGSWRSVGHSQNAFFLESMVDEAAHLMGEDPLEWRLKRLREGQEKLGFVLKKVASMSRWSEQNNRHLGIAAHFSFRGWAAAVIEVEKTKDGVIPKAVWCALDCGLPVNPEGITTQIEGSVVFALAAARFGEITYSQGKIDQKNFDTYRLLRMSETPKIESYIMPSQEKPGGVGEPIVPVIAPALVNAAFKATGKRFRELPLRV